VNHRWTSYVVARLTFADGAVIVQNTTYVQPRFDDFTDIRVLQNFQLEGRVTDVFSMGIDFDINYDSRAPATVKSADYLLGTFLKVGFG
jgi:hypothetical protein